MRSRRQRKGLSQERGQVKSAENLGASPFKREFLIDTTFSQIHLARLSLQNITCQKVLYFSDESLQHATLLTDGYQIFLLFYQYKSVGIFVYCSYTYMIGKKTSLTFFRRGLEITSFYAFLKRFFPQIFKNCLQIEVSIKKVFFVGQWRRVCDKLNRLRFLSSRMAVTELKFFGFLVFKNQITSCVYFSNGYQIGRF
jgi:hypothetical protein